MAKNIIVDGYLNENIAANEIRSYDMSDDPSTIDVKESSELGESLRELNNDELDKNKKVSGIDMRSRLHPIEISSILAVDALVLFKMMPLNCSSFTRQKKRLAVSEHGQGRKEIVDIVGGKREQDVKSGTPLGSRIANIFRGGNNGNEQKP